VPLITSKNNMVNWQKLEIGLKSSGEEVKGLDSFISKYSIDGQINGTSPLRFKLKYFASLKKEKLLFDAYTDYKSKTSINSDFFIISEEINPLEIDSIKLVKSLNTLTKINFKLKHILDRGNKKDILLEIDKKDNFKLFKEKRGWKVDNPSDYIILTICKKRIIIKDLNFHLKRRECAKILEKVLESLNLSIVEIEPYETSFSKLLEKLIGIKGIKYISFVSSNTDDNPIIDLVYRKECPDITNSLKILRNEGKIVSFEQINKLSLILEGSKKTLTIKVNHEIPDSEEDIKVIKLNFFHTELSDLDREYLMRAELSENRLYFEKKDKNLGEELQQLIFKRQLKRWEEGYYSKTINLLMEYNLISLRRSGINLVIDLNYEGLIELLLNILEQEGFNPKIIPSPDIGGIEERLITFQISMSGQKILFPIFIKSPTEKMINAIKTKWLYNMSFPLFSVIKESEYEMLKFRGDFPYLIFSEMLASIFEGTFNDLIESKINEIQQRYSEERIRDSRRIITEMDKIIENKESKEKFSEFESNIYYLQNHLFTGTQKIGGGWLPDGIRLPEKDNKITTNNLNSGVAIWDAKIWFSNFNVEEERLKIARYILASLRNKELLPLGGLKYDFIVGHIEDHSNIAEIFKEAKKEALTKSKRYKGILKKDIQEIKLIYLDFKAIKKIIHWMNSRKLATLNEIEFYKKFDEFIVSKEVLEEADAVQFLENLGESVKKTERTINLDKYRDIGKKIKADFDSSTSVTP